MNRTLLILIGIVGAIAVGYVIYKRYKEKHSVPPPKPPRVSRK